MMVLGGTLGILLAYGIAVVAPSIPMLGPLFEDTSGKGDIHLAISVGTVLVSSCVLLFIALVCGMVPAVKASRLDPVEALRYE
jgi:putative ABC transport system permease protein